IRAGVKTKVLLLSATPVNNDLKDLRNQIYFVTEGRDTSFAQSFGLLSIKDTLTVAQKTFMEWAKRSGDKDARELMDRLPAGFFTLLDELTIARSRKHIKKYYRASMAQIGHFPKRKKPDSIFSEIDLKGRFLSYDKLNDEINNYQLSLYSPSRYVLPQFKAHYDAGNVRNFSQESREKFLVGMMKVNFLKRLESSVHSFAITMERTVAKIEDLEARLKAFQQQQDAKAADIQLDYFAEPGEDDDELAEAFQVGTKLKYDMAHLDVAAWLQDLTRDKQQLALLADAAQSVNAERDANEAVNPLQPYFLVYIREDGEVRYNFTAPKQVLEIFRAVCQGQTEPHAKLCELFDDETIHGQDMSRYSGLLDKAVAAIAAQFGRKNAGNLFTGRGGKLLVSQSAIKHTTDFDLITWLVIKHVQ
ncbi:hypothetical protein N7337_15285, partial [Comamonas aquatica]|nr:hypothetical protein [Comamonas aquatica]MDH1447334.1 hypothetical protein [Comamonas aquatica]